MSIASYNRSLNNATLNNSTSNDNDPSTPPGACNGSAKCSPPALANHSPPPDSSHKSSPNGNSTSPYVIGSIIFGAVLAIVILVICFIRRKSRKNPMDYENLTPEKDLGFTTFGYEDLEAATGGFVRENQIGEGGFGYVYKGILRDGMKVAVKCLKAGSRQGEREFLAEIDIISSVHHPHLVTLIGFCVSGEERMLVYEFVPNRTLEYHLHKKDVPTMDWQTRMKIAVGSAKGFAYLHEDCNPHIIHRDIKASNILLDDGFEAKVSDFGLAKLTTDSNTHVSTDVKGTPGYLDPEYFSTSQLTEKSDVFSFGVVLLELITGKQPIDSTIPEDKGLVEWARPLLIDGLEKDGNFEEVVDSFLEANYNSQQLARMAVCAASSTHRFAKKRPKMSLIVKALEGDMSLEDLKKEMIESSENTYHTTPQMIEMTRYEKTAMSSQEWGDTSGLSSKEMSHYYSSKEISSDS